MSHSVFKIRRGPVLPDPHTPSNTPRYHTAIFVQDSHGSGGYDHHVTGDLVTGMKYEVKRNLTPKDDETFFDKTFIGHVPVSCYPESFEKVLKGCKPPGKQKAFNVKTMRTEPCKEDGGFYGEGETVPRLVKCTEWIDEQAIPVLTDARMLLVWDGRVPV